MKSMLPLLLLCGFSWALQAQPAGGAFAQAEALRQQYRFQEAAALFSDIAAQSKDSLERLRAGQQLILCENGKVLLRYIEKPAVTGKITVPRAAFYHYYELDFGGGWAFIPGEMYAPQHATPAFVPADNPAALYFSARTDGRWNIYATFRTDSSRWTAPEPLGDAINTPFDEYFPYITPDGRTLYFSSNGHSGMGGYDLFKSVFDTATQQWGTPENLGFPYSSPYDDFLFVPDVTHTSAVFASTREQRKDTLTLYRVTLEANPVKQAVATAQEAQRLAQLLPAAAVEEEALPELTDETSDDYRAVRKTLAVQQQNERQLQSDLQSIRRMYVLIDDNEEERTAVQHKIMEHEAHLQQIQAAILRTAERVRQAEQALLEKGIVPDTEMPMLSPQTAVPVNNALPPFLPRFRPLVTLPAMTFLPPPESEAADYTFRTDQTTAVYPQALPPQGLIYQLQIGTFSRQLPPDELKGLTPVFVQSQKNLHIHYAGYFATYGEAAAALPDVRRKFREAAIVAFLNGKPATVKLAREYEQKNKPAAGKPALPTPAAATASTASRKVVLGEYPEGLPPALRKAVQAATSRDIIKTTSQGRSVYVVGPLATEEEAQELAEQLRAKGFNKITTE